MKTEEIVLDYYVMDDDRLISALKYPGKTYNDYIRVFEDHPLCVELANECELVADKVMNHAIRDLKVVDKIRFTFGGKYPTVRRIFP